MHGDSFLLLIHTFSVLYLQLKKLRRHNKSAIDLSNANPACGHKEVPRSTGHIMATTRYSNQQGSKSRQKFMRLYKQWQRPIGLCSLGALKSYFSASKRKNLCFFFVSAPPRYGVRRPNNFFDPPFFFSAPPCVCMFADCCRACLSLSSRLRARDCEVRAPGAP